jgi:hypothetical protein
MVPGAIVSVVFQRDAYVVSGINIVYFREFSLNNNFGGIHLNIESSQAHSEHSFLRLNTVTMTGATSSVSVRVVNGSTVSGSAIVLILHGTNLAEVNLLLERSIAVLKLADVEGSFAIGCVAFWLRNTSLAAPVAIWLVNATVTTQSSALQVSPETSVSAALVLLSLVEMLVSLNRATLLMVSVVNSSNVSLVLPQVGFTAASLLQGSVVSQGAVTIRVAGGSNILLVGGYGAAVLSTLLASSIHIDLSVQD